MAKRDYYEVLGVSKNATDQEIKKAYRELAKKHHPDVSKEADAAEKFKEVQEAYEVLIDKQKRAQYDQFGHAAFDQSAGFGGFGGGFDDLSDIFGSFFGGGFGGGSGGGRRGGPTKGQSRYLQVTIDFNDAVYGKQIDIPLDIDEVCSDCGGSGAYSKADIVTCPTCNGRGKVTSQQRTIFGVFQSETVCPDCKGSGKSVKRSCSKCKGSGYEHKKIKVELKIPAGIQSGQQLRVVGKGEKGRNGGPNGDLLVEIMVRKHRYFVRDGKDISITIPISAVDATLGCQVDVPTPYGDVSLTIPEGTQPQTKFRLKGKGMKSLNGGIDGDQYVIVDIEIPKKLNREERQLFVDLQNKSKATKSVYERFKEAFK